MNNYLPFTSKILKNGIKIFIVEDSLIENDVIIKLKNYGAIIDHYFNVIGFQHLLEHCFFFQSDNYNLRSNASTSFSDMNLEINFQDTKLSANNATLTMIKKWFFKNNDYTKLNFSRDLTKKDIEKYINELDNEFIFRDLLTIPWPLQNFLISNREFHYFGGNRKSFLNKEEEIISFLKKPFPIPTEDINIFLRSSYKQFYPYIVKIFENVKTVKRPKLSLSYNKEHFFNKVVQINRSDLNELIFIIDKNLIPVNELIKISLLFNNFSFTENVYLNEYYISFNYTRINDLCQMVLGLEKSYYLFLQPYLTEELILNNILYYEIFEIIPNNVINYFSLEYMTKKDFYEKEKETINYFLDILKQAVLKKEFIINTKIDNFYKYQTSINEPYNIFDINFNFNNFYNSPLINNNNLWKLNSEIKCNRVGVSNSVDLAKQIIKKDNFKLIGKQPKDNKPSIYFYFESLILYFSTPSFTNLKAVVNNFQNNSFQSVLKIEPKNNIVLTNKNFIIKTEYDFLFSCFQIPNKCVENLNVYVTNLTHRLKKLGLLYCLETTLVKFSKKSLVFFYTSCHKEEMDEVINFIKSTFISNNISFSFNIIKSEKSFITDLSSVKKEIIIKY